MGAADLVQLAEQVVLDWQALEHGLDHEIAVGEVFQTGGSTPLGHDLGQLLGGQLATLDALAQETFCLAAGTV
ncbi:hypothetical protein D3C86_1884190 [compost metagenome]